MGRSVFECGTCDRTVQPDAAIRSSTFGGLDDDRWETMCCPHCGERLKTVFVG
ncbi:hypothetical protein ACFQJ5_05795 [Halomicroarcula sp. GCM10025324]|jgi:DNA-directed RNA polymerase subunit RPC12/RpoP|uniref:hypothetical protein n=1 Tax=Haloarcula TaxID=2237 RepID=UPI0023E7CB0C|nr:hypothetical protein [Halomicroarcula sp. ZS-22-S1]